MAAYLRKQYTWKSFNVKPVTGFDNAQGLSDMAESRQSIFLPPETFEVSSAPDWGFDGASIIGHGQFGNSRPTSDAEIEAAITAAPCTRIKYVGSSGSNTEVCHISETAVGSSFVTASTDDLFGCEFANILFDGNNLADFGAYVYRAGNGSRFRGLSAIRCLRSGLNFNGIFTASAVDLRAYFCARAGISIGYQWFTDTADSGAGLHTQFEWTVNAFYAHMLHVVHCGDSDYWGQSPQVGKNWDESTNPYEGGLILGLGRANRISAISYEGNDSPMVIMPTNRIDNASPAYIHSASNLQFQNTVSQLYLENNGPDVVTDTRSARAYGLLIKNDVYGGALTVEDVFLHPGSALPEQHIKVVSTDASSTTVGAVNDNQGSTDLARQLILRRVSPGGDIYSNTTRFRVEDIDANITYPDETPNAPPLSGQVSGNLTLTVVGESTAGTHSPGVNGRYVKTGRVVQIWFDIDSTAWDGTGNVKITGLPYTSAAQGAPITMENWRVSATGSNFRIYGRIASGSTEITLYADNTDGTTDESAQRLVDTDFSGAAGSWDFRFVGQGSYETSA